MVKEISIKQLERAVAKEKSKAKTMQQRRELESELKSLRAGKSTKLLKRLGRGFVILSKKGAKATGRGIVRARKFAEESGAGEGIKDIQFASALPGKGKGTKTVRVRRRSPKKVTITRRVVTRRVKIKPIRRKTRRKVVRRARQDNNDFFGGVSLGI